MTSEELRKKYLEFFESKGHKIIPSASLIPENDPSVLFTTAGMHPLVPYLMGEKHPAGQRLTDVQKCIRTGDIDEVGDNTHLTFFEMLGNWSLGDYWKKESIAWSFEFLTKELKIDLGRISVTCFAGEQENNIPRDNESAEIWKSLGISEEKIKFLGREDNWWGPAGETGPCGPDTEIFVDGVEIWNNVFMEYNKEKRTLLIDGMECLYDENFNLNQELFNSIERLNVRKILVVNGYKEKAEQLLQGKNYEVFSLGSEIKKDNPEFFKKLLEKYSLRPEELFYFDHSESNIKSAETLGIKSVIYKENSTIFEEINRSLFHFAPLQQKNVDTGMGLERTLMILNGQKSVFETDLFNGLLQDVSKESKIVADHIKAAVFILSEGIEPSNTGAGYVLRRLIRRAMRYGADLSLAKKVIDIYKNVYSELEKNKERILDELQKEEEKFKRTMNIGSEKLDKLLNYLQKQHENRKKYFEDPEDKYKPYKLIPADDFLHHGELTAKNIFDFYTQEGVDLETILEYRDKYYQNLPIEKDIESKFRELFLKHQELSRTASSGMFKGGLADAGEETKKLHTATHLLRQALQIVLGEPIMQRGSNINAERLRFDFGFGRKMTDEEKQKVEELVNQKILENLPVNKVVMKKEEAEKTGAVHVFGDKYGDEVSIYYIGSSIDNAWSKEFCGGPHVGNTSELGKFKITKEEAVSAGVRRIKAILE